MSWRLAIALRWSLALGLLGWGLLRTMIVPFGSTFFVLVAAVVAGPYLVGQARLRLAPRDLAVLRREALLVARVLAAVLAVLVSGLALDTSGFRPAGALIVGAGLAALCASMTFAVCRLWRADGARST